MGLAFLRSELNKSNIADIVINYFIVIIANLVVSGFLAFTSINSNATLFHTIFEIICLFISLSTFFVIWYNYDIDSPRYHLLGLGFLAVAILDAFHVYFSLQSPIISNQFWTVARFVESISILMISARFISIRINRWIGLFLTVIVTFIITRIILLSKSSFFFSEGVSDIAFKSFTWFGIVTVFIMAMILLRTELNKKDELTYKFIYIAIMLAITSVIFTSVETDINTFLSLLSHTLKISYYIFLFNGIFVSSIRFPYEKLKQEQVYMKEILNSLPIGLTTYDENLKINFTNNMGTDLLCGENKLENLDKANLIEKFCGSRKNDKNLLRQSLEQKKLVKNQIITINRAENDNLKIIINIMKLQDNGYICLYEEAKKEQELENLKLQTQTILNSLSNIVVMMDKNNKIILCNKAFEDIIGSNLTEILGMELDTLYKKINLEKKSNYISDNENVVEVTIKTFDNKRKYLILQPANIHNVDGEVIGYINVGSDITDLKIEQEKLQHKDKLSLLGQMSSAIVHETKNLLASIKGYCQLINLKITDEQIKKYVTRIDTMTNDVNRVMVEFLDMAKPRSPVLNEVSINELIKSMEFMLNSSSFIKGIDISIILSPIEKVVMCDEAQIKQIILNMVRNSIDAMLNVDNPGLMIRTSFDNSLNEMVISISDNGKGMTKEEIEKVGSPFFTTKSNGTGLGLNVCYQIIKEHSGRIEVKSEPQRGTTFNVILQCK